MSEVDKLTESFRTTNWLITRFSAGLTHEDSVTHPPFKANTFNWVLGHILVGRDRVLRLLDQEPLLDSSWTGLYESGSPTITIKTAVTLGNLLNTLEKSQEALVGGLQAIPTEVLSEKLGDQNKQSIAEMIAGLHWHETYHLGQLEILRQVSGDREAFP